MIQFMIVAAPRSGTAWASAWLTNGDVFCQHDMGWDYAHTEMDAVAERHEDKQFGAACTTLALYPQWLNAHPARKVILHRDRQEVQESLRRVGLPKCPQTLFENLDEITGMHVHWLDLFHHPQRIHEHLLSTPFDPARHTLLKDMRITSNFHTRAQNSRFPEAVKRLFVP